MTSRNPGLLLHGGKVTASPHEPVRLARVESSWVEPALWGAPGTRMRARWLNGSVASGHAPPVAVQAFPGWSAGRARLTLNQDLAT